MRYTKVIIDLKGRRSIDLVSESGAFSLAGAVTEFIEDNMIARQALSNKEAAGPINISLTRSLYKFLKAHDFYPELVVGYGYMKELVNPCKLIEDDIRETTSQNVRKQLSHGVVRVNGIVVDLTHLRLGDTYEKIYNFPYRDFSRYWAQVKSMNHVADMKMDEAANRIKHAANTVKLNDSEKRRMAHFA